MTVARELSLLPPTVYSYSAKAIDLAPSLSLSTDYPARNGLRWFLPTDDPAGGSWLSFLSTGYPAEVSFSFQPIIMI